MEKDKLKEYTFVFAAIATLFYILIHNAINAPLTIEDEYNNYYWSNPGALFGPERGLGLTLFLTIKKFFLYGRLVISSLIVVVCRAWLFGIDAAPNRLVVYFFGIATAFLVYKIFRDIKVSKTNAFLGSLFYLSGYTYSEIFFRLQSGEFVGNFFLVLSAVFIIRWTQTFQKSFFGGALASGFLAAISKESYILIYPLVFLIPFLLIPINQWKGHFLSNKKSYLLALFLFLASVALLVIMIKSSNKVFSYGQPLTIPQTIINNAKWLFKWFLLYIPIVLAALVLMLYKKNTRPVILLSIFSLAWIATQLLVYYKVIISFSQGRYMMPAGLIFIVLIVLSLEYLRKQHRTLFYLALAFAVLVTTRNLKIMYINANEFGARATAFNMLIDKIVQEHPKKLVVFGGFEFIQSIKARFTYNHYHPEIITTPLIRAKSYNNKFHNEGYEQELQKELSESYVNKTMPELKSDTTLTLMITSEVEEYGELNREVIFHSFNKEEKVYASFSNPGFGDLLSSKFWKGELKNSQRTFSVFRK